MITELLQFLSQHLGNLSRGLRIRAARDDPSGLVISEKLRSQMAGYRQSIENVQRGNSYVSTAEAATHEISELLRRLAQLTVLAADEVLLLAICMTYAFAGDLLGGGTALHALYAAYVLDIILFALRVARTTYLKKIAEDPADITPTISMGITIDHAVAMSLPILSG